MRHVRKELGFIFRGQREFFGLLFDGTPRLLDLLILALHFDVLFGKLLRFLR